MKYILILLCFFPGSYLSNFQLKLLQIKKTQDYKWQLIVEDISKYNKQRSIFDNHPDSISQEQLECQLLKIRDGGKTYWHSYPNTGNSVEWLLWTIQNPPSYFDFSTKEKDIRRFSKWQNEYRKIKEQYFAQSDSLNEDDILRKKCWFDLLELEGKLQIEKVLYSEIGNKISISNYVTEFKRLGGEVTGTDFLLPYLRLLEFVCVNNNELGVHMDDVFVLLKEIRSLNLEDVTSWVNQKEQFLNLSQTPVDWKFETIGGDTVSLMKYKGKVVLIDFWSVYCGSCISFMPAIKRVYDQMKHLGFEVISVSVDKNKEKPRILEIEKRFSLTWPLSILANSLEYKTIWQDNGFISVPQLLLFNKEGYLVATNVDLLSEPRLRNIIKRYVQQEQ
ncbi:MAG TPA: TlpA disulfide reductase family protein [Pseudosphingobacterium sp.]|nr:TlpA disulfide reductase family protein [Pseudosphingobacterium sp.]